MADPLSISAAVVQFLQITVHLCLKLHSFCADMHDVPERLGSLESDLKQQIQVAEDIQNLVSGMSPALNPSSVHSLRTILDGYSSKMEHLLRILDSVSSEPHDGFLRRNWNALRALDKKNAMLLCCEQLAQKKSLLSIWLGKANLDLSHQVKDLAEKGRDQTAILSRQVEANSTKIDAHQHELTRSTLANENVSNEIRVLATQQSSERQEILAAVRETSSEIQNLAVDWQSLNTTLHEFRDLLESNQELSYVILRVASTRSASTTGLEHYNSGDVFETLQQVHLHDIEQDSRKFKGTGGIPIARCTCRAFSYLTHREPLSMLHLKRVFRKRHYSSCPKFRSSYESLEFTIKVIPPTWLLSHTIHVSLILRNWSNGRGFSVAPVVIGTSRIVDPNTSPGFQTVRAYEKLYGMHHFKNIAKFMESLETSLRDIISSGQSSALDEDRDGNTLLYEIIRLYIRHEQCDVRYWMTKATGVVSLAQFLLDNGANPNVFCCHTSERYGASHGTALDLFADELVNPWRNITAEKEVGNLLLQKLTEEGAEFSRPLRTAARTDPLYLPRHFQVEMVELQLLPEQIEACEYNELVQAILERDEARLRKALAKCDSHHQSAATGLSPIHFAVTWPLALKALIQIGVDVNVEDHYHRRPIHLATSLGEFEAVNILLEGDCAIPSHISSPPLLQQALQANIRENRERITKSIIIAYIDRYTRFFDLALSLLPQSSPTLAGLAPGVFYEGLVPRIQQELKSLHFHIPPALELSADGSSVYETADPDACNRWTVQMAATLWDSGFRQIDEYSNRGRTPLLECWYNADFEMIKWLISKGASPFSRHAQTQGSGLHLYARRLGYPGAYFNNDISAVYCDEGVIRQLESNPDSRRDSCFCLCSVGGCTPVIVFLKYYINLISLQRALNSSSGYQNYSSRLRLFWKKLPPAQGEEHISKEAVLRFLVFEKMNLKHQCCLLTRRVENYRFNQSSTDENLPESKYEMEARLSEYRKKMQSCDCEPLEKPLCVVLRDHCKSL